MTTVLVLGGARSGKSAYAERLLWERPDVRYVAAGPAPGPDNLEWQARVAAHRARRPASWTTVEAPPTARPTSPARSGDSQSSADTRAGRELDLPAVIDELDGDTAALVDCLGTWVTRLVDESGAWEDRGRAEEVVAQATERLVAALRRRSAPGEGDVVLVSNEVGLGVVPAHASGRLFRDLLGRLNAAVASACDHTVLVVAGRVLDLSATPTIETAPTFGLSGTTPPRPLAPDDGIDIWADAGLTWTEES